MSDGGYEGHQILESILNNTTTKVKFNSQDYIVLIKKQQGKQFCTFFLTDCSQNIWIQKIDIPYCEKLKQQMNVKSSVASFATHFAEAVRKACTIEEIQPSPVLKMQLRISQGLIINCTITLTVQMNSEESPAEYRKLLKIFFLQLYDAKEAQINSLEKQLKPENNQQQDNGKSPIKRSKDDNYIKSVLNLAQKKQAPSLPPPKNRDLINPLKKKRKQHGIKLTGGE